VTPPWPEFPDYSTAEKAADAAIHLIGLIGAGIVLGNLLANLGPDTTRAQFLALIVYTIGLIGMLSASALYNLTPPRAARLKRAFRHLDHAMIFVMIAGSYTPITISALRPGLGEPLCAIVWVLAALGIGLRLAWMRIYERVSLALYLGMGWLVLIVLPPLAVALSGVLLALLVLGGVIYSLGTLVHTLVRVRFQNAAWHTMVVVAAALHLVVIVSLLS
jgi:hemolysin III